MATEPLPNARVHNGQAAQIPTLLLVRDELVGFAKSKVMLVLWLLMPALALAGYLLLPAQFKLDQSDRPMSATAFITVFEGGLAGLVAGLMAAVDLVSEKNRNVYVMLVIRPIRRETIVWAKFIAVTLCVVAACVFSVALGFALDAILGAPLTGAKMYDALKSVLSMTNTLAIAAAAGILVGVMSRTILAAVLLFLYIGQNFTIVPMLPVYFGAVAKHFWLLMAISVALIAGLMWLAGWLFRRAQL